MTVALIDSGVANLTSVMAALDRLDAPVEVTKRKEVIQNASHVILPGVGAASAAMARLESLGLSDVIRDLTQPVLGICLGMQLLFSSSEEGEACACLGIIPAPVKRLSPAPGLSIPHMGWNQIIPRDVTSPLLRNISGGSYFYFVHSFAAALGEYTLASCDYGGAFTAIAQHKNFLGCQFHPERSGSVGARILKNFLDM